MSCNVFAVDFSYNVRLYDSSAIDSYYSPNLKPQATIYGAVNNLQLLNSLKITLNHSISAYDGLLLDVPFYLFNYNENNAVDGYANFRNVSCGNVPCQILGYDYNGSSTGQMYHVFIYISGSGSLNNITFADSEPDQYVLRLYDSERFYIPAVSAFRFVDSNGAAPSLDPEQAQIIVNNVQWVNNNLNNIYDRMGFILNKIPTQEQISSGVKDVLNEQKEQEKQETNQAIDDSKNTSNNSSSDVQNNSSTQSLLSVITGFFGAITSASPTSCVLSGQINEYLTPSFDLCQLDPPPALTALLSIPVAIALFFFAKHMLNKIIALIRSFQ